MESIAHQLGESETRIRYALTVLETEGAIHISGWDLVESMRYEVRVPRYRAGPGTNVPPPLARINVLKRLAPSPLDHNPGADLQAVTLMWGLLSIEEHEHAQE